MPCFLLHLAVRLLLLGPYRCHLSYVRGAPCPRPLRSRREPDGIRGVRGTSLLRVKQANRLYAFCVRIMLLCIRLQIPCVVENPARSLMWATSFFRTLPSTLRRCISHSCMYGSRKKKATALLSSIALPRMMRICDGRHSHEPWSIREIQNKWHFSTSDAAEYEPGFCKALAACQAKGCVPRCVKTVLRSLCRIPQGGARLLPVRWNGEEAKAEVLVARLGDAAVHLLTFPHSLLQQVEGMKMKGAPLAV